MANALSWFEIPVTDMQRAVTFYNTILGIQLKITEPGPGFAMATFPSEGGVSGALVRGEGRAPSTDGTIVYLNGGTDCGAILDRVAAAGDKLIQPKTSIGEFGFLGIFVDTEGNRVSVHSIG
jgi:predicted enzyme related to lactoylglutathione lyase